MGGRPLFFYELDPKSQFQFIRNETLRLSGIDNALPSNAERRPVFVRFADSPEHAFLVLRGALPIVALGVIQIVARSVWGPSVVTGPVNVTSWLVFACATVATFSQAASAHYRARERYVHELELWERGRELWDRHGIAVLSEAEQKFATGGLGQPELGELEGAAIHG
jgi:hypothetical protein